SGAAYHVERECRQAIGSHRRPRRPSLLHQLLIDVRDWRQGGVEPETFAVMDERQEGAPAPAWRKAGPCEACLGCLVLEAPTPIAVGIAVHRREGAVRKEQRAAEEEIEVVLDYPIGATGRDRSLLRAVPHDWGRAIDDRIVRPDRQIVDVVKA